MEINDDEIDGLLNKYSNDSSQQQSQSGVKRDAPDDEKPVEEFVAKWQSKIKASKQYFEKDFKNVKD